MVDILQGLLLGAIQGVTEFFPVSSSGHLILIPALFGWEDQGLLFDTVLHLGTLVALCWVFRTDIRNTFVGTFQKNDPEAKRLLAMIVLAAVPGVAFGGLFGGWIEMHVRGVLPVIFGLVFWGFALWVADRYTRRRKRHTSDTNRLSWTQVLVIGFSQAIALFPGTSRSGITMTSGLFSGLDRSLAVRFSFLMSIPTVAAAGAYGLFKLLKQGIDSGVAVELLFGFLAATLTGIWAIQFLRSYVSKHSFTPFVIYRLVLAVIVFLLV